MLKMRRNKIKQKGPHGIYVRRNANVFIRAGTFVFVIYRVIFLPPLDFHSSISSSKLSWEMCGNR